MTKKRILRLTLRREFFDKIVEGKKKIEYRDLKDYWIKRLFLDGEPIIFDEIHFINGYSPSSPFVSTTHLETVVDTRRGQIEIHLGRLLRVENYIVKTRKAVVEDAQGYSAAG